MQHILFKTWYLTGYLSYRTIYTTEDRFYQYVLENGTMRGKSHRTPIDR